MITPAPASATDTRPGALEILDSGLGATLRPEPYAELFKSVTALAAERRHQEGLGRLREAVRRLPHIDTRTLVLRLSAASDALLMWAIHLELDRRGVPPCLRWPSNVDTTQAEFITWLADMYWFAKRHPEHKAQYRGWRDLLAQTPATAKWHAHACRQFAYSYRRPSFSNWCAQGLALSDEHRQELMTLPTRCMQASRRAIRGGSYAELAEALLSYAVAHPDKAGVHDPQRVASRRASLLRVHVLAGKATTRTTRYWRLLTGESLTRQAVAKQIAAVDAMRQGETRKH